MRRCVSKGFTLVEVMIVTAIMGILAAISIPNFIKAREDTRRNTCRNSMRQIFSVKQQWALEYNKTSSDTPTSAELTNYIHGGYPSCPLNGTYTIGNVTADVSCSIHGSFE